MSTHIIKSSELPCDTEVEKAVLGQLLISNSLHVTIIPSLKKSYFSDNANRSIFLAIRELYDTNTPIDLLSVVNKLKKSGTLADVGGAYYVSSLTNRVATSANIETHVMFLKELYIKRAMYRFGLELSAKAQDITNDSFEVFGEVGKFLSNINEHIIGVFSKHKMEDTINDVVHSILNQKKGFRGINTGNDVLNKETGGFIPSNLIILAARPSMGKTARALQFMVEAALSGVDVLMFSIETSKENIIKRLLIQLSGISSNVIAENSMFEEEKDKLHQAAEKLKSLSIYIDDNAAPTIDYIRMVTLEHKRKYPGKEMMIVIDYLQIVHVVANKNSSIEQNIASISIGLKRIAKETNSPVIALAQLSREVEKRSDKRPLLSDLRHSGQIEQDADVVLSLYRPSYYYEHENDHDYKDFAYGEYVNISEMAILKNKDGGTGVMILENFLKNKMIFTVNQRPETPDANNQW